MNLSDATVHDTAALPDAALPVVVDPVGELLLVNMVHGHRAISVLVGHRVVSVLVGHRAVFVYCMLI